MKYLIAILLLISKIAIATPQNCQRPNWSNGWYITDSKGKRCKTNTRHMVLNRDGINVVVNSKCLVVSGKWYSYYTGTEINDPKEIEIDHRLPWAEMKKRGVCRFSHKQISFIYNNDENLVIATKEENRLKSDHIELPFAVSKEKKTEYIGDMHMFCLMSGLQRCEDFW